MTKCSAYKCNNIGVHKFPKDPKRKKLWEISLKRANWKSSDYSKLCSAHFKPDDYYGKSPYTGCEPVSKFLKHTAVPSIFSFIKAETPLAEEPQEDCKEKQNNLDITVPKIKIEIEVNNINPNINDPQTNDKIDNLLTDKSTQTNMEIVYGCIHRFKNDDNAIYFYTGFESYKKFKFVYKPLSMVVHKIKYYGSCGINISHEDQFFLTLMKIRQGKCNFELSRFFKINVNTVTNIFITWINFIHHIWTKLNIWPEKDLVHYYNNMPNSFKQNNVNITHDKTKIKVEKPENSEEEQVELAEMYEPDDYISADDNFNDQDKDVKVNIAAILKRSSKLAVLSVVDDENFPGKRIHIERLIGLMNVYKIMKTELHHTYVPLASKIFFVCFMCCHFRETEIKK